MGLRIMVAERLTEAQLDALAEVSASDVQHAATQWRADAPERYRGLLDATAAEGSEAGDDGQP
jgi:hypothetical protein